MQTNYNGHSAKSGVYQIRNLNNGRVYIGSAKCFRVRQNQHLKSLVNGTHHNKFLQNDFNKCGEEAFVFEVLQVVEGEQTDRLLIEQTKLDLLYDNQEMCYNFKKQAKADSRTCFSKDPEKTKKLMSEKQKALWRDPQHKEKMSKAFALKPSQKGYKMSEATRQKVIEARKLQKNHKSTIGVIQFDLEGNVVKIFPSVSKAIDETRITNIINVCRGKRQTAGNYYWRYSSELDKSNINEIKAQINQNKQLPHKNSRKIMKFTLNGEYVCTYDSITAACNAHERLQRSSINKVIKGIIKQACGYKWSYVENE